MPCPPCYADLGKQAKDLFLKNYHFGLIKLECKTTSKNGVGVTVSGDAHQDTGAVEGCLETKYRFQDYCMTLTEKWNTDNILQTELTLEDGFITCLPGLKLTLDTSFAPETGQKTGRVKTLFKRECVCINADVDFENTGPVIEAALVFAYCGWRFGVQCGIDTAEKKLTSRNGAVGFTACDFIFHANVNDGNIFGGSIFQKVNDCLDMGIMVEWEAGEPETRLGLACKYSFNEHRSLNVKANNMGDLGVGYTHRVREGILVTLSAMLKAKPSEDGSNGHFGFALELEP